MRRCLAPSTRVRFAPWVDILDHEDFERDSESSVRRFDIVAGFVSDERAQTEPSFLYLSRDSGEH